MFSVYICCNNSSTVIGIILGNSQNCIFSCFHWTHSITHVFNCLVATKYISRSLVSFCKYSYYIYIIILIFIILYLYFYIIYYFIIIILLACTDEYPGLRIESVAIIIIKIRGVYTNYKLYISRSLLCGHYNCNVILSSQFIQNYVM